MEYNDWYERYQKYQAQQNPQPKKKKGVSIAALVAAVLVAALVAGVAGGFVTSAYLGKTQASALPEQQQAALPENSDPQPEKKPSVLTEAPASSQGSSLLQNGTGTGYTKAQIVEIAAPSVVGIDVTIPNTNSGYNFGWGFNFGDGFCNYILPTSTALMGILGAANVPYDRWMRFMWKMFAIWLGIGAVLVVIAQLIQYGPM